MIVGNLNVEKTAKGLIHIGLHTDHRDDRGVPYALFTVNELETLIGVLRGFQTATPAKPKPMKKVTVVVPEDDVSIEDLI